MALTWKYNAKKPGPPAAIVWAKAAAGAMDGVKADDATTIHEIVWHDDAGAVLHPQLNAEADALQKRVDELRAAAKESHDSIVLPANLTPDQLQAQLREIAKGKLAALKANLGIAD